MPGGDGDWTSNNTVGTLLNCDVLSGPPAHHPNETNSLPEKIGLDNNAQAVDPIEEINNGNFLQLLGNGVFARKDLFFMLLIAPQNRISARAYQGSPGRDVDLCPVLSSVPFHWRGKEARIHVNSAVTANFLAVCL